MVRAFLRVERAVIVIKNVGDGLRAVPWILVHKGQNPQFPYLPNPSENLVPGAAERHIGRSLRIYPLSF